LIYRSFPQFEYSNLLGPSLRLADYPDPLEVYIIAAEYMFSHSFKSAPLGELGLLVAAFYNADELLLIHLALPASQEVLTEGKPSSIFTILVQPHSGSARTHMRTRRYIPSLGEQFTRSVLLSTSVMRCTLNLVMQSLPLLVNTIQI